MKLVAALIAFIPCFVLTFVFAPAPVSFGIAVAGAVSWCRFLDQDGPADRLRKSYGASAGALAKAEAGPPRVNASETARL